jgi:urease accessory protein
VRFGATIVAGLLLARWLAWDVPAMRRHYGRAWTLLRSRAGGLPARLPPLWHI